MESRIARMNRFDEEPDYGFPDVGDVGYLVDLLLEIGEATVSGGKLSTIGWQDLSAWTQLTGLRLAPHEYKGLRMLSSAYVSEFYRCDGNDMPSPFFNKPVNVESKIKSLFAMLRGNK